MATYFDDVLAETVKTVKPTYVCPVCDGVHYDKHDLRNHLKWSHSRNQLESHLARIQERKEWARKFLADKEKEVAV